MEILKQEITQTKHVSTKTLTVTVTDAQNYQGQFIDAIILVHQNNRDLNLDYFFAKCVGGNVYELSFSIR